MRRVLIRREKGAAAEAGEGSSWGIAPLNDGAGGTFETLSADIAEWWRDILADAHLETDASVYYAAVQEEDGLLVEARPLVEGTLRHSGEHVFVRVRDDEREVALPPDQEGIGAGELAAVHHQRLPFTVLDGVVVWLVDGGRDGWCNERKQRKQEKLARGHEGWLKRRRRESENNRTRDDHFINPYTFAPLPETVHRQAPRGHASMKPVGLSGWFDWTLTLTSPMLIPAEDAVQNAPLAYPGSSLRGVLRNLHENLAGGCLRIIDADYLPIHRDPMAADRSGAVLAVVSAIDPMTHRVTQVTKTTDVSWIPHSSFDHSGVDVYSGNTLDVDVASRINRPNKNRYEIPAPGAVKPGSDWVMHVTHAQARPKYHNYYVAVGRLTDRVTEIKADTWKRFVRTCEGAADLTGVTTPPDTSGTLPGAGDWPGQVVEYDHRFVGKRRTVDGWLGVGDTVWLTSAGDLKMAVIWRSEGQMPVADRVTPDLLPCRDPERLCPSCAVFGSVDNERTEEHEQRGYASHIRVGWGSTPPITTNLDTHVPPLRSPRPSSGGFYLQTPEQADRSAESEGTPKAHWGSSLDEPTRRPIAGRKFYWHGQVAGGRQVARDHHVNSHSEQLGEAAVVPSGTVITARVAFDNLDADQLGWLLAAAEPSLLFGKPMAIHVGGGKPLGYGSATPTVADLHVSTARQRYGGDAPTAIDKESLVGAVAGRAAERGLTAVHEALQNILKPDAVHADRIWYPTKKTFAQRGTEDFDKAFAWFSEHSGGRAGPLTTLPDASDPNQYLPTFKEEA